MAKKLGLALLSGVIVLVAFWVSSVALLGELKLADGTLVSDAMPSSLALIVFVAGLVAGLIVSALANGDAEPRRRSRSSGTVVEEDVEDGRERGVVKWFNVKKGFGFITWDEGEDVFVHFRSIRGQGHRSLTEGQRVKFTVVRGDKGPQAEDVSAVR
ncbi:cold-shock protein [Oceanobacter mangrovi]|uniref:cold-shock protein n=1 Tax=Oceanobacter mangrovi TaxID=2862510 RepID=UPI001C8EECF0|nr:cold shock domain-containing protein [Oceanobacter mangrovi]